MSIWDLHVDERDGRAECRPWINAADAYWRAAPWGSVLGQKVADVWNAATIRETVSVAEMRPWCWHLGAGDIHGVLVDLDALDMLLGWFGVEQLEMVMVPEEGGGLLFSDGERIAHVPGSRWTIPEILPCRVCGATPDVVRRAEYTRVDGSVFKGAWAYRCGCGMGSPWREDSASARDDWNVFCSINVKHPPIWKWSAREWLAKHRPAFTEPTGLAWVDDEGNGPSTVPLVLEGVGFSDEYPGTVRLRLHGTVLEGAGGMDLDALRHLYGQVAAALAWVEDGELSKDP